MLSKATATVKAVLRTFFMNQIVHLALRTYAKHALGIGIGWGVLGFVAFHIAWLRGDSEMEQYLNAAPFIVLAFINSVFLLLQEVHYDMEVWRRKALLEKRESEI